MQKNEAPFRMPQVSSNLLFQAGDQLDDVEIKAGHGAVEVGTNHLLAVARHHAFTWGEVLRRKDGRCDNQRHVRSVDVSSLQVASALEADEDLISGEVRILVDREPVAQGADLLCAD